MSSRRRLFVAAGLLVATLPSLLHATPPEVPSDEALVERERIRPTVEGILSDLRDPENRTTDSDEIYEEPVRVLASLGPAVGPFLAAEIDLPDRLTFVPAAWTLGLVDPPGGREALRKALEVADREGGGFGRSRKAWFAYALAIAGEADVLDRIAGGETPVDWVEFMEGMRLSDVAAALTAPASLDVLSGQVARFRAAGEEGEERLLHSVRALGWTRGRSSAIEVLKSVASHPSARIRAEAMIAMGRVASAESFPPLLAGLRDASPDVRVAAAHGVAMQSPPASLAPELLARLEVEDDGSVRAWLYRAVARSASEETTLEALRSHLGRADSVERTIIAVTLGEMRSKKGLNLLRTMLRDREMGVAVAAARSIRSIGGEGALDTLVALLSDPRPPVSMTAVELLTEARVTRAAPRIAGMLVALASRPLPNLSLRTLLQKYGEALVELRYVEPREDLRRSAGVQPDAADRDYLLFVADRLDRIAANGSDVVKWAADAESADPAVRALARQVLGRLGGDKAVAALVRLADSAPPSEEADVLLALAETGAPAAGPVFVRRLEDEAWDLRSRRPARNAAAWGARRLGTPAMARALAGSIERRDGRDLAPMLYLAQIAPGEARKVLEGVFRSRLRHFTWYRGEEQETLQELLLALSAGAAVDRWDVPPERLHLH